MQKIKNIINSNSNDDTSSSGNTSSGLNRNSVGSDSSAIRNDVSGNNTTSGGLRNETADLGSRTGHSGLTSGNTTGTTGNQSGLSEVGANNSAREGHGLFGQHQVGHSSKTDAKFDPSAENVEHDHKHLNHVTHADHHHHEVESVQREREHERHVHHLQHHVQPVRDVQEKDEVHHNKAVPVTRIEERHANTSDDVNLFKSLGEKHQNTESHRPKERTVVDLGEKVHEKVHHHVHHVTQPVVEQEVHERHHIHTVIPTHHTTHEAPIIHKSSLHEPVAMQDFIKGGGKLGSGITHDNSGVLATGDCSRTVDGVGEKLAQDLNLSSTTLNHTGGKTAV